CKTGKHTTEKLVITKVVSTTMKPIPSPLDSASSNVACSRCKQGFICSEHGSQPKEENSKPLNALVIPVDNNVDVPKHDPAPVKKIVGPNQRASDLRKTKDVDARSKIFLPLYISRAIFNVTVEIDHARLILVFSPARMPCSPTVSKKMMQLITISRLLIRPIIGNESSATCIWRATRDL
ncbi:hypothetical protein IFM89_018024, partial [Coptis chinensis]